MASPPSRKLRDQALFPAKSCSVGPRQALDSHAVQVFGTLIDFWHDTTDPESRTSLVNTNKGFRSGLRGG